jgi:hypothetical protein
MPSKQSHILTPTKERPSLVPFGVKSILIPIVTWTTIPFATLATGLLEVDTLLHKLEFDMLSCLGVNQHVKIEWWKLAHEFGGIGLFNILIKHQFMAWIEVILQHYGAGFTTSKKLRVSIKAMRF